MTMCSLRMLSALCIAALIGGCINLGLGGGEATALAQYRLEDASPTSVKARATPIDRRLLISTLPSETIGDTYSMAYTRAAQQRQYYQFASWTDRPSARIEQLLMERVEARGAFESVSRLGGGIGGGLTLNIGVNEFVHDIRSSTARIEVTAELIERRGRTLVDRRRFTASAPVAEQNAASAVSAWGQALTKLLDELIPWLETTAEALPRPEPRPPRDGKS